MLKTPILFIIFNRLDTTQQVFAKIREVQPEQLFIAADGPRPDKDGEDKKCKVVRDWVLSHIDWDCKVETLFREKNLGCGQGPAQAITWFFTNVEQGIILEDDCVPTISFFHYCETLLNYYKNDSHIMHITGDNPLIKTDCKGASYYFASIQHCWGWATWARAWKYFNFNIECDFSRDFKTNTYFNNFNVRDFWMHTLFQVREGKTAAWDYQWNWAILKQNGLCINPALNQITNIGCNSEGTHFSDDSDKSFFERPRYELSAINHPKSMKINKRLQKEINKTLGIRYRTYFQLIIEKLIILLKRILKRIGLFSFLKRLIKGTG